MRILVTGRDGQLGRALAERVAVAHADNLHLTVTGRDTLDLERLDTFARVIDTANPDVIINAAAYTAVDQAEDEPDLAMRINAAAPGRLAEVAAKQDIRFVQVSTDYVFAGAKTGAYVETDPIDPRSTYGHTKAAGEMRVREAAPDAVIIRTAWVISPFGNNFVKTMCRLAKDRETLGVVDDQHGNPTSALDLAEGMLSMCRYWQSQPDQPRAFMGAGQTFHLAGTGNTTWAGLAREVFRLSAERGGPSAAVNSITTADYPTKATRPANSQLDCGLFRETFGFQMPAWQTSLKTIIDRLDLG